MDDLSAQPTGSIPLASGGWAETKVAYRLLDNDALDGREVLEVHPGRTAERMRGISVRLVYPGYDRAGFHVPTGDRGVGAAE